VTVSVGAPGTNACTGQPFTSISGQMQCEGVPVSGEPTTEPSPEAGPG
jgi:hypothetical protein